MGRKNCIKTKHLLTLLLIFGIFVLFCSFQRYREGFTGGDDDSECDRDEAVCDDDKPLWDCDKKIRSCTNKKIQKNAKAKKDEIWKDVKIKKEEREKISATALREAREKLMASFWGQKFQESVLEKEEQYKDDYEERQED